MREIVDQLLQGKYTYTQRNLDFSTARIELTMVPMETIEGSFTIYGSEKSPVYGSVTSSDIRMEVLTGEFSGSPFEISYRFNSNGMSQGDVLKGEFRIISNQGEYVLPFVVTVRVEHMSSSLGDIRNLFHFANLAKTSWNEALGLYYSQGFISILKGNDERYESLYRGLSTNPGNEQNVEEFLISINKKHPVEYICDQQEVVIDYTGIVHEHTLLLTKNGWGYIHLGVETVGDFFYVDRDEIAADDFSGAACKIKLHLRSEQLCEGNNFGRIILRNCFTSIEIPVKVSVKLLDNHITEDYREMKRLTVELVKIYESFGCKKITARVWLSETGKIISKMNAINDKNLEVRLYTAHYYITAGRTAEGKAILDQIESQVQDAAGDTLYSYFLYLSTLCSREESYVNDISETLEGIFKRSPDDWRIAWLIQFVSEEYSGSSPRKWMMLEQQFAYGCRSPILYMEAMNILNDTPAILTKFGDFELYVLEYGAKRQIISLNLTDQVIYLSSRIRGFNRRLFKVLKAAYELKENAEILEQIVSLLIKGGITDRFAFEWYARGVERELRVTRLYEYYMMSFYVDSNGLLPCEINKMVLMYFSYQSDLEYDKNAILYRYVHEHKQQYPELYESYAPQIEKFLMAQLDKGRTSRDLGYLYKNLLTKQMVDASNASKVLAVLNTSEIRTNDKRINAVIVVYDKCEREMRYPVNGGMAYVPLYGSDYAVLLTDQEGNRYAASVSYTNTKLMLGGKLSGYAIPYIQKGMENLDLFLCDLGKNAYTITMDNVERYRDLAESELVRESCKKEIRNNLVRFYYDNDFTRQLSEYLLDIDPSTLSSGERNEMLELLVLSGLYDRAIEWVKTYGTYGIDARIILRLCVRMLDRGALETGQKELEIAHYAFRNGKYDEQLLGFLAASFLGTVKEMRDIWKAAESFGLDTYNICERMLIQMMFSGSFVGEKIDIFKSYVQGGANTDVELAFITQSSYDCFVHGSITDRYVFERIEKLALENLPLQEVCKLAYLRHYANDKKPDEEINKALAMRFLRELLAKDVVFPFYMEYQDLFPDMVQFIDKTMLEYRTTPGARCSVHYRLDNDSSNEYRTAAMREMYEGIFVSEFILFFGERMQYYITEDSSETGSHTESGMIQKSDILSEQSGSRYSLINDIMIGETLQDYDTTLSLIGEYYRKSCICDVLFKELEDRAESEPDTAFARP
ncbi:MAG: DUF5717 family protein [Butyrivibrio sp.]|nr:DUF5717 family protein [Butyrivibrio sp.]